MLAGWWDASVGMHEVWSEVGMVTSNFRPCSTFGGKAVSAQRRCMIA
jgi:hypothetical protein